MGETEIILGPPGTGKCLGEGTPVIMFDGTIKVVEQVKEGDMLMGPDSLPHRVKSLARGREPLYRIEQNKGDSYVVNESHILSLKTSGMVLRSRRMPDGSRDKDFSSGDTINISVRDYLTKSKEFTHHVKGYKAGVDFDEKPLLLDPYYLGVWLGDGSTSSAQITNTDQEVIDYIYAFAEKKGLKIRVNDDGITYCLSAGPGGPGCNQVINEMRAVGVFGNKHIPQCYKSNSRRNRMELLAGLLDTDAYKDVNGNIFVYYTQRDSLSEDVVYLARSLGFMASRKSLMKSCTNGKDKSKKPYWSVYISGDLATIPNKVARRKFSSAEIKPNKNHLVTGITVVPIGMGNYFGFELDGGPLFLLGDFTVTHNTTELLRLADEYLAKGGDPMKMAFVSFTKKAVQEARFRAQDKFKIPEQGFIYYRTIHSLAFYMLSLSKSMVMQRGNYRELGQIIGIQINGIQQQDAEIYEMPEGDRLVFLESLSRLKCKSLRETWDIMDSDVEYEKLEYFRDALVKYKTAHMLYDFTDMLEKYMIEGTVPDLNLLIVDEAQDLCLLQWRIIEKLKAKTKQVYIAGDDDQAIFRWSGAEVEYFLQLPQSNKSRVLDHSYRLPAAVFSTAASLLARIQHRNEKPYTCTEEKGKVELIEGIEQLPMEQGEWLLLHRNGYYARQTVLDVRVMGFPYECKDYSTCLDPAVQAAFTWEQLRAGQRITAGAAKDMAAYIHKALYEKVISGLRGKKIVQAADLGPYIMACLHKKWFEVLTGIPQVDLDYYISVRRRNEPLLKKPRIKISTIHAAKGGEAENVVLFTDMTARSYKSMFDNMDDEVRVFYVGVTRAKKNLYIVNPQTANHFTF